MTQMVWKATTELGCGAADCGPSRGVMYVCRYNPPGNVIGTFNEQVSPAGAA